MISLTGDNWDIEIDPENGSLFRRCRYNNTQVFRDFAPSYKNDQFPQYSASNFPLLPYSNRIEDGVFVFENRKVALPVNAPGQIYPIHGYGWIRPWRVLENTEGFCLLSQYHEADHWPWSYEILQRIEIFNNSIRIELHIKNKSQSAMPCGLGFHPYFPDLQTAFLTFESSGIWLSSENLLPTQHVPISEKYDLSKPRLLRNCELDHCYTEVKGARIHWEDKPTSLRITHSNNLNRAAVYTDHAQNTFCFEPVSHVHNALTMQHPADHGIAKLSPEETAIAWMNVEVLRSKIKAPI